MQKKKFMIAVDLEGVAGVVGLPNKTLSDPPAEYAFACRQGAREANAAAEALFAAGAEEVTIWDNHGPGVNLDPDLLDPRCRLLKGSGHGRWPGMDETYAAVLMIGYHAMAGTKDGVLAHTYSSQAYQWLEVNGEQVGEMAIDAHMAGMLHVPVLFVASDEAGAREAERFMPWVKTVATKKGFQRNCASSLSPQEAANRIRQTVGEAVAALETAQCFAFAKPMRVRYRYMRMEEVASALRHPGCTRVDDYTVEWQVDDMDALFGAPRE